MDEITPEQKKEIKKAIFSFRLSIFGLFARCSLGLFGANIICILIGIALLKDADPEQMVYFETICMIINFIFTALYLHRQRQIISDRLKNKILEVLKK
jgi:hypothetical protein